MPMFKARKLCPDAVVIRPDFAKYGETARRIRASMERLTPLVQPLSIDEAALDLSGTEALHGAPPAAVLARFAREVEREMGLTVSIGLAPNRLLAKIAAGRDKPRGFAVIGAAEARAVLAPEPVRLLPGVGPALARRLAGQGITQLGQLQDTDGQGRASPLWRGRPSAGPTSSRRGRPRASIPGRAARSVSAEATFDADLTRPADLERQLWRLSETLARRLKEKELAAGGIVLKLKTAGFATRTRTVRLPGPTALPDLLFGAARVLLAKEADGTAFRLIGIGASPLLPLAEADRGDLADTETPRRARAQAAIDSLRRRYGEDVIARGRARG